MNEFRRLAQLFSIRRRDSDAAEEIAKLKIGMPWEPGVNITPLTEPSAPFSYRRAA